MGKKGDFFAWIKRLTGRKGDEENSKPEKIGLIQSGVIVIIVGLILIVAGSTFFKSEKPNSEKSDTIRDPDSGIEEVSRIITDEDKADLERKISDILSKIDGAGKVDVAITYVSGTEKVPALDTKKNENNIQERAADGSTRSSIQSDLQSNIVFEEAQGGGKKPIITKELLPQVKGVVIVADGASDDQLKEKLCKAVQVLVDIPIHKIQVFERAK